MTQAGQKTAFSKLAASLLSLEKLNFRFRRPFETPRGECVLLIESFIRTPAQITELHNSGMLNHESIGRLLRDPNPIQRGKSRSSSP
jgi:hypothetical protein